MKARWILVASAAGFVLALGAGLALAGPGDDRPGPADRTSTCEEMHGTRGMQEMHANMPREARAQCEAMHARMDAMHGQMDGMMGSGMGAGMMGPDIMGPGMGSGMMGPDMMGSGMMSPTDS